MAPLPAAADLPAPPDLARFIHVLHQQGVHAALGFLNQRTPHRYTGIYRFERGLSRNAVLFDRYDPSVTSGEDVPLAQAFCALVGREQASVQILDATLDARALDIDTLVVSYCGVLIRNRQGQAFGTLCHYDLELCQEWSSQVPLLEAAAPLLYQALHPIL